MLTSDGPSATARLLVQQTRSRTERLFQLDRHLLDLAGELVVALGIVFGHRSGLVHAHIGSLVSRKEERRGIADPTFGHLLPIHRDRSRTARTEFVAPRTRTHSGSSPYREPPAPVR